jgi:uncharacterized protein YutE (UPF0331/DUF86 family)
MDSDVLTVLRDNLKALNASLNKLKYSRAKCLEIGIKDGYSEEEFTYFEALTARYARTTDMLISKVLRSIDTVEFIDDGTIIDVVNRAEKRGLINSVSELRQLKDLRNNIAHEYQTDNIAVFFEEVLALSPLLCEIIENVNAYCARYFEG